MQGCGLNSFVVYIYFKIHDIYIGGKGDKK